MADPSDPGHGSNAAASSSSNPPSAGIQPAPQPPSQPPAATPAAAPAAATPHTPQEVDRIVLNYLNQKGYKKAEYVLKREANLLSLEELEASYNDALSSEIDGLIPSRFGNGMLNSKAEMANPDAYDQAYSSLRLWVENSLDLYKPELISVLYPLFVHSYLHLVDRGLKTQAKHFMDTYRSDHIELHSPDIIRLATVIEVQHVKENELAQMYKNNKYHLRMSPVSLELLIAFLQDNKFIVLLRIVNQHLNIQVGPASSKEDEIIGIAGHGTHQLTTFNKQKVTLGQMPPDAALREQVEQTLKEEEAQAAHDSTINGGEPPATVSLMEEYKKVKTEAEADTPSRDDVPMPPFKGSDIQAEIEALRDSRKRVALGPSSLPSICAYTFHNAHKNINCVAVSEDATLMAAGFSESYVRIWSLKGEKLRGFRSNFNPARISDSNDLDRVREKNGTDSRKLIGHAGPVFGASFSPDNKYLITCSEDKTARLWSTNTLTNVVCYKGHNYPVWDVDFGPQGFYFATASHDRTARLWSCDQIYPLRIFAGHMSDVDVVKFHPNSKYLVTGSSDKTARLWDVQRGTCVRVFTEHVGAINAIAVSPDGRTMASAGEDKSILLWDLGSGRRVKKMTGHQGVVYSLDFSQDGSILMSGSADCTVRAWDVKKEINSDQPASHRIVHDASGANGTVASSPTVHQSHAQAMDRLNKKAAAAAAHAGPAESEDHLATFPTKRTPIYKVQFTKRNLCLAVGAFAGN
ncbi:transcription initiation factor TFIID subunit 5 [Entomortierella parvispora]|uniref:Transcription initiation factor TFIID subunit 5 n=1 Tax=Entomortierella parvispora TaxID=205924 RepID=A0A9P3HHS6_9FUNG|nr:transcription initiation factor TFIID subunit 5 [Entomortierella parvispora]